MTTSQTSILSEIRSDKPISARTKAYYRRRLQNLIHRVILKAFRDEAKKTGLTQKELAKRIESRPEQVNRWLGAPNNLTVNTIADMLLGIGVDLDKPSVTPIEELVDEGEHIASAILPTKVLSFFDQRQFLIYLPYMRVTHAGQLNAQVSAKMEPGNEEIYSGQSAVDLFLSPEYIRHFASRRISGGAQSEVSVSPFAYDPRSIESATESGN